MKKIPKKQFDEIICLSRKYWDDGTSNDSTVLQERIKIALEFRDVCGIDWMAIIDFVDSIIRTTGILPGASNKMIYFLLRSLGWEVAENVEVNTAE